MPFASPSSILIATRPRHPMGLRPQATIYPEWSGKDVGKAVRRLLVEQGCILAVILSRTEPQVNRSASFLCYVGRTGTRKRAASSALRSRWPIAPIPEHRKS